MRLRHPFSCLTMLQPKQIQHWLTVQGLAIAASAFTLLGLSSMPVKAQRELVIEVPIPEQVSYDEVMNQSEELVTEIINQRFGQNSALSFVQIAIVGSRHGEILPLMKTAVSRSQWQSDPRVVRWTDYNSVSQSLLTRPASRESDVVQPPPGTITANPDPRDLLEDAFNDGLINQEEYETLLDTLD